MLPRLLQGSTLTWRCRRARACAASPPRLASLLRSLVAKASGGLARLDVELQNFAAMSADGETFNEALTDLVRSNTGALRRLRVLCCDEADVVPRGLGDITVASLLAAAPNLVSLDADIICIASVSRAVLRGEAPFSPVLHVRRLYVWGDFEGQASVIAVSADSALCGAQELRRSLFCSRLRHALAVAAHHSLTELVIGDAPLYTAAALDAVVEAAVERRLARLYLYNCHLGHGALLAGGVPPAGAMPALARLVSGGSLTTLAITSDNLTITPAFCTAVRGAALECLILSNVRMFVNDTGGGVALVAAVTGHRTLRHFDVSKNFVISDNGAVGDALGSLVASNSPSLTSLNLAQCALRDEGLRPLAGALPRNAHLRVLNVDLNSTAAFAPTLLAAVRANASLRRLDAGDSCPALLEAAAVVAART